MFEENYSWSLCSDNAYQPGAQHFEFDWLDPVPVIRRSPIGRLLTRYNHANTTTVLDWLYRTNRLRIYAERSLIGPGEWYTNGAPADDRDTSLEELPVTISLSDSPRMQATDMGNGMVNYTMPCGGALCNEGHLEQILNHAIHILYTEGPRSSDGPGFKVQYSETGESFADSDTRIAISFFFNGHPVWVKFARRQYAGTQSPCAVFVRALPQFLSYFQPPVTGFPALEALENRVLDVILRCEEHRLEPWEVATLVASLQHTLIKTPGAEPTPLVSIALAHLIPEAGPYFSVDVITEACQRSARSELRGAQRLMSHEHYRKVAIQGAAAAIMGALTGLGLLPDAGERAGETTGTAAELPAEPGPEESPLEPGSSSGWSSVSSSGSSSGVEPIPAVSRRQRRRQQRAQREAEEAEQSTSTEERARREAVAEAERARRQEIHDAYEAALRAEENARELRRKLQAIESRKAAAAAGPKPYTPRTEPPKSKKSAKKQARAEKRFATKHEATLNELEHGVHIQPERHAVSEAAFHARQDLKHAEKVARDARARADRLRNLAAAASAAHEAATHVVPPRPTFEATLEAAIAAVQL